MKRRTKMEIIKTANEEWKSKRRRKIATLIEGIINKEKAMLLGIYGEEEEFEISFFLKEERTFSTIEIEIHQKEMQSGERTTYEIEIGNYQGDNLSFEFSDENDDGIMRRASSYIMQILRKRMWNEPFYRKNGKGNECDLKFEYYCEYINSTRWVVNSFHMYYKERK